MAFSNYESSLFRGIEESRPWQIQDEIRSLCRPEDQCLDLGCGTLFKWLPLLDSVASVTGLELNDNMICGALKNIRQRGRGKMRLIKGDSARLPFSDNSFDLVTAIMAPSAFEPEVSRILRPGGRYLLETPTEQDQRNIKEAFGKDDVGWRYSRCSQLRHSTYGQRYDLAEQFFDHFSIRLGRWKTWYSREALLSLLEQIPWIRDYSAEKDQKIIETLIQLYATDQGVETVKERILLIASKQGDGQ
ncbi:MAG: class I SAM-dependent methyltransferase [Endozoicomonas sp.]